MVSVVVTSMAPSKNAKKKQTNNPNKKDNNPNKKDTNNPKIIIIRRNARGQFSRSGQYTIKAGKLVKIPPSPRRRARRRARPAARAPEARETHAYTTRKGATYTTLFKAMGTDASKAEFGQMQGGDSPSLLNEPLDEESGAPAAFYSNQSLYLGRVKFKGIVSLDTLLDKLNEALQAVGQEVDGFDFMKTYRHWSYKYQVIEHLGPTDRVIDSDSKRR